MTNPPTCAQCGPLTDAEALLRHPVTNAARVDISRAVVVDAIDEAADELHRQASRG